MNPYIQQWPTTNYCYYEQPIIPLGSVLRTGDIVYGSQDSNTYRPKNNYEPKRLDCNNKEFETIPRHIEYGRKDTRYNRRSLEYEQYNRVQPESSSSFDNSFLSGEIIPGKTVKWSTPLNEKQKSGLYQGDERECETISSNTQALAQYEEMGIKQRLPIWVDNVRYWISNSLIPAITIRNQRNIEGLNQLLSY